MRELCSWGGNGPHSNGAMCTVPMATMGGLYARHHDRGAEPVEVVNSSRPTQGARVFMGEGLLPVPSKLVGFGGGNLWKCLNSCWSCKCLEGIAKQALRARGRERVQEIEHGSNVLLICRSGGEIRARGSPRLNGLL